MVGEFLRLCQRAAVRHVERDARRPKRVRREPVGKSRIFAPPLHHRADIHTGYPAPRQRPAPSPRRTEQRLLFPTYDACRLDIFTEAARQVVMRPCLVQFAALLMKMSPPSLLLAVAIMHRKLLESWYGVRMSGIIR